ncbi:POK8 protein, partial [Steatornis caripensis]|nr:POK8 protein [Steatornis caripensis]
MGALQPGLPNPAMIPEEWHLLIVDLKDCFFTIALHPEDQQRFAITSTPFRRAREAHSMFHQNAKGLVRQFKLKPGDAKAIVRACPTCSHHNGGLG